jgi:adenylate cyclase
MLLRFRGPVGTFETFSAAGIIESEILAGSGGKETIPNADSLKDAYVFFGFSAPGLLDLRPTPISRVYPGVEIHATMLDNLLSGDFLRDAPPRAVAFSTLFFSLLASILTVALAKRAWHSAAAFAVFSPLPATFAFAAYPLGYWWPIAVQQCAVFLALSSSLIVNYATEGRRRAFVKKAFQHYLSPAVIERILVDPSHLKLGGERRELTILFSDLEGFSTISEKLDPEALTSLLNDYLSDMTDIILEEGGTLDKYEGDAIIAFWNAPLSLPDHAQRACSAALKCQRKLSERREEFRQRTGAILRARIGINTGEVVVGNLGSKKRFDYTILGDAANLASRLEGANKAFATYTMISEATWSKTSGSLPGRQIGLLRVVGRNEPVRVFELNGIDGQTDDSATQRFETGLALCFETKWREALEIFETLPDDPVAKVYAKRCRGLLAPPGQSWDGVWNLSSK